MNIYRINILPFVVVFTVLQMKALNRRDLTMTLALYTSIAFCNNREQKKKKRKKKDGKKLFLTFEQKVLNSFF